MVRINGQEPLYFTLKEGKYRLQSVRKLSKKGEQKEYDPPGGYTCSPLEAFQTSGMESAYRYSALSEFNYLHHLRLGLMLAIRSHWI
ncbi:MAG: hypothetical protein WAN35_14435, partial [Terracidiphilus sp.]